MGPFCPWPHIFQLFTSGLCPEIIIVKDALGHALLRRAPAATTFYN